MVRGLVTAIAGLLLGVWLATTLELALGEAALNADSDGVWDLYREGMCMRNGRLDLTEMSGAYRVGDAENLVNSNITKCSIGNVRRHPEDCVEERISRLINGLGLLITYISGQR